MESEGRILKRQFIKIAAALFFVLVMFIIRLGTKNNVQILRQPGSGEGTLKCEEEFGDTMPKITNMIMGTDYYIALCEDKNLWSWGNNSTGKLGTNKDSVMDPQKITGLEGVVKIIDGGENIYALLDSGEIYI